MKKITLCIAAMLSAGAIMAAGDEVRTVQVGQGIAVTYFQPSASSNTTVALYRDHHGLVQTAPMQRQTHLERVQTGNGSPVSYYAPEQ